jgi:magnesium-transporting ATPase (P-type)
MAVETLENIDDTSLTESQVLTRQQQEGYNELSSGKSRSLLAIAADTMRDPIFLLLLGGGVIYWILGDLQEALILPNGERKAPNFSYGDERCCGFSRLRAIAGL